MTELFDRSSAVVLRYGGTVDKFTGDGLMAVFGAPVALEDHALRACLAAVDIQREAGHRDGGGTRDHGLALLLRVGLNSGAVITGEIGSGCSNYTAVGEQVGLAQRMEPRVLLCASTWRFSGSVEDTGFDELRDLSVSVGDDLSLGLGMAGMLTVLILHNRYRDAALSHRSAAECRSR